MGTVILAAGASRRMGCNKLLLPWGAGTVIGAVITTALAATCGPVVVVTGAADADIRRAAPRHPRLRFAPNDRWEDGMLRSAQTGVASLPEETESFLVTPGDLPLIRPDTYRELMQVPPGSIAVPTFGGRRGHPVRIPGRLRGELLALDPAADSLRTLVDRHGTLVHLVETGDPGIRADLDSPEDYARMKGE